MATISYQLKGTVINYGGGVVFVDNYRSYDVGSNLTAGSGTITIDAADTALVAALDGYAALRRSGSSDAGVPAATTKNGPLIVSRPDPVTVPMLAQLGVDGTWTTTPSSLVGSTSPTGSTVVAAAAGIAATDTAAIQAAIDTLAAANGGTVQLLPGTYVVNGLTMRSKVTLTGAGEEATIVKLANGANTDVIKGDQFDALTMSGNNTGGITKWKLRNLTVDGNKANNASGYGVRVYGFDFKIEGVVIRNAAQDGLYTEWGRLGLPGADGEMEANYERLLIHHCGGNGWLNRGPHDSHFNSLKIQNNGGVGLWCESSGATTVAAGSNGVDVTTFAGAGVLNVVTATVGFPTSGTLTVATSGGTAQVTYTGKTQNTFTGCRTASGTGTLSTGGAITMTNQFSGTGLNGVAIHIWGPHTISFQSDNSKVSFGESDFEGGTVGQVWLRAADCSILGGKIFTGSAGNTGSFGLRLGDTNYKATNNLVDTIIGDQDFAGTSSSTASVDFVSTDRNLIKGSIVARAGTSHITGTPGAADCALLVAGGGASRSVDAGNSLIKLTGTSTLEIGSAGKHIVKANATDVYAIDPANTRFDYPGGFLHRFYSGAYSGETFRVDAAKGHLEFPGTTAPTIAAVTAAIGTTGNGQAVSVTGNDRRGTITITTASTGLGTGPQTVANITFAASYLSSPRVTLTPQDGPSAAVLPYAKGFSTTQFLLGFNGNPAASTTYTYTYSVDG